MTEPVWITIARKYLGTREVKGKGSNPAIMRWASRLGGWIKSFFKDDDIPWCALFVNGCLAEAQLRGTNSLAARSFENWGYSLTNPRYGAIVVFSRKGGGHVGFYMGEDPSGHKYRVLGGNQSDSVNETWISTDRLVAIRWPIEVPLLPWEGRRILQDNGETVSTNEA